MSAVQVHELVPAVDDSTLALSELVLEPRNAQAVGDLKRDSLLYVFEGAGSLAIDGSAQALGAGTAGLVLAGEEARLEAADSGLRAICAAIGSDADRHAPFGPRQTVVTPENLARGAATGARSFQILFGPHNGSTRATHLAGFIPPGKAPWHYHLYDEIVWVPDGPGRLHSGDTTQDLESGSAFRLRPREVHIVENLSAADDMTVIGIFTPAGSPSAAYLTQDVAAEYRFAG